MLHYFQSVHFMTMNDMVGEQFLGDRLYKSSAVAEMGDRGHNRHGPKRGEVLCPFRRSWDPI